MCFRLGVVSYKTDAFMQTDRGGPYISLNLINSCHRLLSSRATYVLSVRLRTHLQKHSRQLDYCWWPDTLICRRWQWVQSLLDWYSEGLWVGQKVLILMPDSTSSKLFSRWIGPGIIKDKKSSHTYLVDINGSVKHIHADKLRKYRIAVDEIVCDTVSAGHA